MKFSVIDKDGIWVVNRSEFRMPDGDSGVIYEPGIPTRINDTEWRKTREDVIVQVDDPMGEAPSTIQAESLLQAPTPKKKR